MSRCNDRWERRDGTSAPPRIQDAETSIDDLQGLLDAAGIERAVEHPAVDQEHTAAGPAADPSGELRCVSNHKVTGTVGREQRGNLLLRFYVGPQGQAPEPERSVGM